MNCTEINKSLELLVVSSNLPKDNSDTYLETNNLTNFFIHLTDAEKVCFWHFALESVVNIKRGWDSFLSIAYLNYDKWFCDRLVEQFDFCCGDSYYIDKILLVLNRHAYKKAAIWTESVLENKPISRSGALINSLAYSDMDSFTKHYFNYYSFLSKKGLIEFDGIIVGKLFYKLILDLPDIATRTFSFFIEKDKVIANGLFQNLNTYLISAGKQDVLYSSHGLLNGIVSLLRGNQ